MSVTNGKVWIWAVTQTNWDAVRIKKIWSVDVPVKSKKIHKGDTIIFYVEKTGFFRGAFKTVSEWHAPTAKWPDGREIALEIDLEEIETGYASTKKLSESLEFVTNPSKIGPVLMGNKYGPSNFGRSISNHDHYTILDELRKTKSPEAIGRPSQDIDAPEEYDSRLTDSPVRLHLIKCLFENLLGPKNGPGEEIENVADAYVVGILRTEFNKPDANVGTDPFYTVAVDSTKADPSVVQDDDEDKASPDYDLNPLLGARSIGLSFVVSGERPRVRACFTWGRYAQSGLSKKIFRGLFRRQMNFFITQFDLEKPPPRFKPEDHPSETKRITKNGVEIEVVSTRISEQDDRYRVSIFLINRTPYLNRSQSVTDWIFQPQIRVKCADGTTLQELELVKTDGDGGAEDANPDRMIYRQRRNMGRGHFCGTVWDEVDPEDYGKEGFSNFSWPDSKSKFFPDRFSKEFTRPNIRTEFFPTYSILQPDIDDLNRRFAANELSDIWDGKALEKRLGGIVKNYDDWIRSQEDRLAGITDPNAVKAARSNLANCRKAKERIDGGIRFLKSDESAKLAFCFMNKAIDLKSNWEGVKNFSWREFQLSFILQCLRGVAQQDESERDLCDILWFPTGGGKTEAYLGLTIFTIAFLRLQRFDGYSTDGGVSVISRYTLRLLTIQQFQRAVAAVTAADYLRVTGWLPSNVTALEEDLQKKSNLKGVWGGRRISIGLLIGRSATPNKFRREAESILCGDTKMLSRGEPSQVLNCPCCQTVLAVPMSNKIGLDENANTIHWIFDSPHSLHALQGIQHKRFSGGEFDVPQGGVRIKQIGNMSSSGGAKFYGIRILFKKRRPNTVINGEKIKQWWRDHVSHALSNGTGQSPRLASTSPERPGYFFVKANNTRHDFAIYCPNSYCQLNMKPVWFENTSDGPMPPVPKPFKIKDEPSKSLFMPIPAFTIDEQVFRRCPSMLISTVDKFAMLPFIEDFATIFGNIDQYDEVRGYGRQRITVYADDAGDDQHDHNATHPARPFLPPSLVIQDELHLIEGPLGSMVGAYEIAFDILSSLGKRSPKYIASSATIKEAQSQVGAVYRKKSFVFPPHGISVDDNYFSRNTEDRESKSDRPGRLYLGVCAPKNILTLPVRIWASLLSEVYKLRKNPKYYGIHGTDIDEITDPYWTLVGYYNAIRELQISRSLYEDDIKRNVRELSCQKIHSVDYQTAPLQLHPGLRFFPVLVDREMDITAVVLHCNNSKGSASVAVFDNSVNGMPENMIMKTKLASKQCSSGTNEFELKDTIHVSAGDILWVSIANDSQGTKFEAGQSQMKSLFADISSEHLENIFSRHQIPANPVLYPTEDSLRLSLTTKPRDLGPEPVELAGYTESQELPNILKMLNKKPGNDVDAVFTTAVFGTGIDIQRLGLMIVMGQPKTASAYIQSTGRVGRSNPGLVITWHRATNVRDLSHYENFVGYHRMLQLFVEPMSASPFSEESLRLCLGPVLVSILRNSGDVSREWVDNKEGPMRMAGHSGSGNGSIERELGRVYSNITERLLDPNIPKVRRPAEGQAEIRVKNTMSGWAKDVRNLRSDGKKLQYREWTIMKPPQNNVVLGTPQHDIEKKTSVFKNVRTSMREVESIANFGYNRFVDGRQLRPSQFVTTYGPGSLLRIGQLQMVMPSLQHMIQDLGKNEQYCEADESGRRGLDKFQISDRKLEKTILGVLEKNGVQGIGTIKVFKLPSNADLSQADGTKLYTMEAFPRWAICKRHNVLKKMEFDRKWALPCSACRDENLTFDEGIGVRFIQACPKGHMDDLDWQWEIHRGSKCDGNEYDWDEEGNDFEVTCRKCDAKTTYGDIRNKSENNRLECSGHWAETLPHDSMPCREDVDGDTSATAKLILKNASNLRITHVVSSLVIPPFADRLYNMLSDYGQTLMDFSDRDFSKDDVIQKFEKNKRFLPGVSAEFFSVLNGKHEDEIKKTVRAVLKEMETETLSEQESEDSEFEQLLHASEHGYPEPITGEPADFTVDKNKVETFHSAKLGIDLAVTPIDTLHVVRAQVGYRREVKTSPEREMDQYMISTTGELVPTFYEERTGTNSAKWFVGKKIKGEGIFIYAKDHRVFNSETESFVCWREVSDAQDDETLERYTHPVFVWWHSFAHRLVADLSIDSGFQSAAIAEKTYFRKNPNTGEIESGILLYAVQEGGDGTLGGLTGLVPSFGGIIERAILRSRHCSNDPLCRERRCNPRRANGSACHACMLISETSCGLQNRFLDRNLLLESI